MSQRAGIRTWIISASVLGCASAASPAVEQLASDAAEAVPCSVPVLKATEPWRRVQARDFTFCVPTSWRPAGNRSANGIDARTWRGEGGSITWGTGAHRPRRVATAQVIVRAGEPLPPPPGQVRRFGEIIDGRPADMWDNEFEGKHYTGAEWSQPAVYIEGDATTPATARIQLAVYRTVRFSAQ